MKAETPPAPRATSYGPAKTQAGIQPRGAQDTYYERRAIARDRRLAHLDIDEFTVCAPLSADRGVRFSEPARHVGHPLFDLGKDGFFFLRCWHHDQISFTGLNAGTQQNVQCCIAAIIKDRDTGVAGVGARRLAGAGFAAVFGSRADGARVSCLLFRHGALPIRKRRPDCHDGGARHRDRSGVVVAARKTAAGRVGRMFSIELRHAAFVVVGTAQAEHVVWLTPYR